MRAVLAVLALALAPTARAQAWSTAIPLVEALSEDGTLLLDAGAALRIELDPGDAAPGVASVDGRPLPLQGTPTGLFLPAAGTSRALVVTPAPGTAPRIRTIERRGSTAAWARFERQVGWSRDIPVPPWPAPGLRDMLALRSAAVDDPAVVRLGAAEAVALRAPLSAATHAARLWDVERAEPGAPLERQVRGPGVLVVRSQPETDGALVRYSLGFSLDGEEWGGVALGSTGAAPRSVRVWVPPGRHQVGIASPDVSNAVITEEWRLRPRLARPMSRRAPPTDPPEDRRSRAAFAEATWLLGGHATALPLFRDLLGADDAAGRLARMRVIEGTSDPAELRRLAALSDVPAGEVGRDALASAVLSRAEALPPEIVLAAVTDAEVDPEALARWLNGLGGVRPRGLALLEAATPPIEVGPSLTLVASRERSLGTRWTRLDPAEPGRTVPPAWSASGPGVLRGRLVAGGSTILVLPDVTADRVPLLRLHAPEAVRLRIDGMPMASPGGRLDFALPPGAHEVVVDEGELIVLDPELAADPTTLFPAYEWRPADLPAAFALPDHGWAVELRVLAEPAAPLLATLDDGTATIIEPDTDGVCRLRAGPLTTQLTLSNAVDQPGRAAVDMLSANLMASTTEGAPAPDVDAALTELAALSRRIGDGDLAARLERAALLATLSLRGAAERDIGVVLGSGRSDMERLAWRTLARLDPGVPTAPVPGPATVEAALAAAGVQASPPTGPPAERALAIEALASEAPSDAGLWAAAAVAWEDGGDLPRAVRAAQHAGPLGAPVLTRLVAHARWQLVQWPEDGSGLVPIPLPAPGPEPADAPLWRRAREAMLGAPWSPSEAVVLRGPPETADLLRFDGTTATVELFCRDEAGPDRPCATIVRFDRQKQKVSVPSGADPVRLEFVGAPGRHELEVTAAGEEHALVVAASRDGERLPPQLVRAAHRASPVRPARYTVATPAVVEVEILRGEAEVRASDRASRELLSSHHQAATDGPVWLPLTGDGAVRIEVRGDADVVVRRASIAEGRDGIELPEPPPPAAALPDEALAPLVAALALPPPARLYDAGSDGTWRLTAGGRRDLLRAPTEPWWAGDVGATWMRATDARWGLAGAWLRGPQAAGGLRSEVGHRWNDAFVGLGLDAAAASGVAGGGGHVQLRGRGRYEHPLTGDVAVRGDVALAAGWWSSEPVGRVDPWAWSRYHAEHPVRLSLGADLVWHPMRDLALRAGPRARSNTDPSLDRVGVALATDLLLAPATRLGLDALAWRRLVDTNRDSASTSTRLALGVDHTPWLSPSRRLEVGFDVAYRPVERDLSAGLSLSLLLSPHRGLGDLPPASTPFRTLLEASE